MEKVWLACFERCCTRPKREPLHHSSAMKKAICCGVLSMYCDVASGFNFQVEHFLHLYRVEREKVALRNIIQSDPKKTGPNSNYSKYTGPVFFLVTLYDSYYNEEGLARLCSTISVEPTIQEDVASSVSVKKKQLVVHQSKKNADCADITKIKDEKTQTF